MTSCKRANINGLCKTKIISSGTEWCSINVKALDGLVERENWPSVPASTRVTKKIIMTSQITKILWSHRDIAMTLRDCIITWHRRLVKCGPIMESVHKHVRCRNLSVGEAGEDQYIDSFRLRVVLGECIRDAVSFFAFTYSILRLSLNYTFWSCRDTVPLRAHYVRSYVHNLIIRWF